MVTEWIPIVGIITSSIMVIVVVMAVSRSRERRVEVQMQMQTRLIERFGTAAELVQFLHSPAGRQFVSGVQAAPKHFARERIAAAFTRAIVLISVGVAFVAMAILDSQSDWYIPAAIVFSLGLGFLIAAFVTWRFATAFKAEDDLPPALPGNPGNAGNQ